MTKYLPLRTRFCFSALMSLSAPCFAEIDADQLFSMDIEQLLKMSVITANKAPQKVIDAAAVLEIITQKDIQNFGANSLLEVLDRATSIAMSGTFFFAQNSASMRGGVSTSADHHVLLLLNGRPMRDSFTGGENFAFYTAFPLQLIKQIEIIRGPGSVLYGSNAFTGVINIITHGGDAPDQFSVTAGSFATTKIEASTSVEQGNLKFSAGLHQMVEDGWQFNAIDNNGVNGQFDSGEDNLGLVVSGSYDQLEFNSFYIRSQQDFWGTTSTWSIPSPPAPVATSELAIETRRKMLDLGYQLKFGDHRYLDMNLSYNTQKFTHINYDSESKNTFAEFTHHWTMNNDMQWLIGGSIWHQDVASYPGARVAPVPPFSQNWYTLYSQLELQQTQKFKWSFGAQVNKIPDVNANTVPRVGIIYQFDERSGIKVNHGQAFRAAYGVETNFDLIICCRDDGSNRGGLRGNPSLEPEVITTTDAQYYRYDEHSQLNATVFYSKQKDLVERERAADNVIDFINRGELKLKGLELEYKYTFSPNSQLVSAFTYQTNTTGLDVDNFTLAPNHLFKLGYTHKFDNQARLGLFNAYFDDSHDNIVRHPTRQAVNPPADGYNLMTLNYHLPLSVFESFANATSYFELYGYNLLDEDIYQPEVAGGQINTNPLRGGRSWYLSYTMVF